MKLTPRDIEQAEFPRAMRGYHREEVHNFLALVANEVGGLIGEHRELGRRLSELQKETEEYRKLERTLMDTLVSAQRSADEMRDTAQREGEVTKREAQVRAEQLVDSSRIEAERLLVEARQRAYQIAEEARQKAYEAVESSRKIAADIEERARTDAAEVQRHVKLVTERRDAFVAGMRAYLSGQLEALSILMGDDPATGTPVPERHSPIVTDEEAEALAALDRELAEFAVATAPGRAQHDEPAEARTSTASADEAAGQTEEPGQHAAEQDGSEVLIERREESA